MLGTLHPARWASTLFAQLLFALSGFLAGMGPDHLTCQGPRSLLVIEDDVRPPDELRGDADGGNVLIVNRVPAQLVVMPLLSGSGEPHVKGLWGREGRGQRAEAGKPSPLTCFTHTFVVIIWFFSS